MRLLRYEILRRERESNLLTLLINSLSGSAVGDEIEKIIIAQLPLFALQVREDNRKYCINVNAEPRLWW